MKIEQIEQLVAIIQKSGIGEIEVKEGENSIRITAQPSQVIAAPTQTIVHAQPQAAVATPAPVSSEPTTPAVPAGKQVKSPMVGTFYGASSPGAEPFVKEGQTVKAGETLCIIEAMKIMNQIEAEHSGKILKVMVRDGDPVEYDQPLFIIG